MLRGSEQAAYMRSIIRAGKDQGGKNRTSASSEVVVDGTPEVWVSTNSTNTFPSRWFAVVRAMYAPNARVIPVRRNAKIPYPSASHAEQQVIRHPADLWANKANVEILAIGPTNSVCVGCARELFPFGLHLLIAAPPNMSPFTTGAKQALGL